MGRCVLVAAEMRAVLIRAAAVHRSEAAFDWLLSIIEDGTEEAGRGGGGCAGRLRAQHETCSSG